MRTTMKYRFTVPWGLALCLSLAACGGGNSSTATPPTASDAKPDTAAPQTLAKAASTTAAPAAVVVQPANTAGRLLASNCFQCHGTQGTGGFDSIRGKDANEVYEYLTKPASGNIMAGHAQGYTKAQLQAIVAYLQK